MRRKVLQGARKEASLYAYCNVLTKQVLYSVTRVLSPRALKQLPDMGANYTPPKLRKDVWRPLFSVTMPPGPFSEQQVLHAYKKLREYRKLHELYWEPPMELSRPYTQRQIDQLQEELDNRGGSKKETVYDLIKRKKWLLRQRVVMDQKANSIADLAAVLIEQDEIGRQRAGYSSEKEEKDKKKEMVQMRAIATEAAQGGEAALEAKIEELTAKLNVSPKDHPANYAKEIQLQNKRLTKMRFIANALGIGRNPDGATTPPSVSNSDLEGIWETYWAKFNPYRTNRPLMPKRGQLSAEIKRRNAPQFTTEGIVIKWANLLDAEYAEAWPENLRNSMQPMGKARHIAPDPLKASPQESEIAVQHPETTREERQAQFAERRKFLDTLKEQLLKNVRKQGEGKRGWLAVERNAMKTVKESAKETPELEKLTQKDQWLRRNIPGYADAVRTARNPPR